jgi:hypothetical protein
VLDQHGRNYLLRLGKGLFGPNTVMVEEERKEEEKEEEEEGKIPYQELRLYVR